MATQPPDWPQQKRQQNTRNLRLAVNKFGKAATVASKLRNSLAGLHKNAHDVTTVSTGKPHNYPIAKNEIHSNASILRHVQKYARANLNASPRSLSYSELKKHHVLLDKVIGDLGNSSNVARQLQTTLDEIKSHFQSIRSDWKEKRIRKPR